MSSRTAFEGELEDNADVYLTHEGEDTCYSERTSIEQRQINTFIYEIHKLATIK